MYHIIPLQHVTKTEITCFLHGADRRTAANRHVILALLLWTTRQGILSAPIVNTRDRQNARYLLYVTGTNTVSTYDRQDIHHIYTYIYTHMHVFKVGWTKDDGWSERGASIRFSKPPHMRRSPVLIPRNSKKANPDK